MICVPRGWRARQVDDALVLAPADASMSATLRYIERRRPVRAIDELMRVDGVPPGFVARTTSAPRWLRTAEGELAVMITCEGAIDGVGVELSYGYVVLDDFYASLTGLALAGTPAIRETVAHVLASDVHVLGWSRRRRYAFAPPVGWHATGDGFFDGCWRRGAACLWAQPALPNQPGLARATLAKLAGGTDRVHARSVSPCESVATTRGLVGEHHRLRLRADDVESHVFFLVDDAFLYAVRVDGDDAVGPALIETIEPIARPRLPVTDAMQFWAE